MTPKRIWRRKIASAVIVGLVSGVIRAIATWTLEHLL